MTLRVSYSVLASDCLLRIRVPPFKAKNEFKTSVIFIKKIWDLRLIFTLNIQKTFGSVG